MNDDTQDLKEIILRVAGKETANKVISAIFATFAGCNIYIPRVDLNADERNREILQMYNGKNMREVARKYDLSSRRIFAILSAAKG